jgi:hypothetical protein
MTVVSKFMDKFGLPMDVALVAIMFATMFASMAVPALYNVSLAVIAVMSVFTTVQVLDVMRS